MNTTEKAIRDGLATMPGPKACRLANALIGNTCREVEEVTMLAFEMLQGASEDDYREMAVDLGLLCSELTAVIRRFEDKAGLQWEDAPRKAEPEAPICEICSDEIGAAEVARYQDEVAGPLGTTDEVPACHEDCAALENADDRMGRGFSDPAAVLDDPPEPPPTRRLGGIYACISDDHRYASRVDVALRDGQIVITRSENGAVGGMDGPGGAYGFEVRETAIVDASAKPAAVVRAIKGLFDDTIRRYGKPTKNFDWESGPTGLSAAKFADALAAAVAS